jgi:ribulose-5-phosphate 4-epimerase/fuculose-1-phosphate aldolase
MTAAKARTTTAAEERARERLAQCARAFSRLDLLNLSGHVSLRIPDSPDILITPGGGLDKGRLTAADMATMDASGAHLAGPYPSPLETPIHTIIHAARPELAAIAHLHAHWCTVWSVVDRPLDVVVVYAASLRGTIPVYEEPRLITTTERAQRLSAALGQGTAVLMRGHGITVVGRTLEEMFKNAVTLEENARILWEATALAPPKLIPLDLLQEVADDTESVRSDARAFQYYVNLEAPEGAQRHHMRGNPLPDAE